MLNPRRSSSAHRASATGAVAALSLLASGLLAGTARADAGELDPTFGDGGDVVITSPDPAYPTWLSTMRATPLSGGGAIVAATMRDEAFDRRPVLARLAADGSYDESFGDAGVVRPLPAWPATRGALEASEAFPLGGGFVVGGTVERQARPGHFRETLFLTAVKQHGARDRSFATNGVYRSHLSLPTRVVSVADGTVLVCGNSPGDKLTVIRLDSHGAPIAGFGDDGVSHTASREDVGVAGCALGADGGVIVAQLGNGGFSLTHLTASGEPDKSFGGDGEIYRSLPSGFYAVGAEVYPSGKVAILRGDGDDRPSVMRRLANGNVDPSFGGGAGVVNIELGNDAYAVQVSDIAFGPAGTILVSGARSMDGSNSGYVARLLSDGSLDPTFGRKGVAVIAGPTRYFAQIAAYPDGRILARDVAGDGSSATLSRILG